MLVAGSDKPFANTFQPNNNVFEGNETIIDDDNVRFR